MLLKVLFDYLKAFFPFFFHEKKEKQVKMSSSNFPDVEMKRRQMFVLMASSVFCFALMFCCRIRLHPPVGLRHQ